MSIVHDVLATEHQQQGKICQLVQKNIQLSHVALFSWTPESEAFGRDHNDKYMFRGFRFSQNGSVLQQSFLLDAALRGRNDGLLTIPGAAI
jgi:hypothetical protein